MPRWLAACLAFLSCVLPLPAQELSLKLPPLKTTLNFGDQPVAVSATGVVTGRPNSLEDIFRLVLTVDMGELQNHIAGLLRAQLNSDERCGDRLAVTAAALAPGSPAGVLTANLHYERWVCIKVLGKEVVKKLVGGDGVVPVALSPSIEAGDVRMAAEVGTIQARGALGEILRSPPVRDRLKERIGASLQSALQGTTNLKAMLPPGLVPAVTLTTARFADAGSGRLSFELAADIRLPAAEIRALLGH